MRKYGTLEAVSRQAPGSGIVEAIACRNLRNLKRHVHVDCQHCLGEQEQNIYFGDSFLSELFRSDSARSRCNDSIVLANVGSIRQCRADPSRLLNPLLRGERLSAKQPDMRISNARTSA